MQPTRAVITDLLPGYLSGDASADTRALVEEFLRSDPEFARLVQETKPPARLAVPPTPPNLEVRALRELRRRLRLRRWLLALAVMFTVLPFSFAFDGTSVQFVLLRGHPPIAGALWGVAVVLWAVYWRQGRDGAGSLD